MPARSRAVFALVLVALLLVTGVSTVAAASLSDPALSGSSVAVGTHSESNTSYRIDMQPNGDARWTITFTVPFEDDADRAGFETVADRFRRDDYSALTIRPYERATVLASNATDRPMRITDVNRTIRTNSERGSLVLSFTWTNFGYRKNDQLYVDDAFEATSEPWFTGLDEDEQLVVSRPRGYQFVSASTNIQNRTLRWEGPHSFVGATPYVVYDEIGAPTVTTSPGPPTSTPTPTTTTTPPATDPTQSDSLWALALVGLALFGAIAAVAYVASRREDPLLPIDAGSDDAEDDAADDSEPRSADPAENDAETESDDRTETAIPEGPSPEADDAEPEASASAVSIDEALLSDEERVERLLEQNGGRMKQANIVTETDWSNAKVSQLLSAMAEEGRIEKLRIGRENLISFPDEDVTDDEERGKR